MHGVLTGGRGGRNGGEAAAEVASELRVFAAWYAVGGLAMLRAARSVESDDATSCSSPMSGPSPSGISHGCRAGARRRWESRNRGEHWDSSRHQLSAWRTASTSTS